MSDIIKNEASRSGAAALINAAAPAPVLAGVHADGGSATANANAPSDGDRAVRDLMASLPWSSRVEESNSPLDSVLSAFGHDRRCRRRVRAGLAVTCACATRQKVDDPAIVIGLALRFARTGMSHRLPLPHGIVEQLARHVGEGDPAAIMVWDWLARRGFVTARVLSRNERRLALRLVCAAEER